MMKGLNPIEIYDRHMSDLDRDEDERIANAMLEFAIKYHDHKLNHGVSHHVSECDHPPKFRKHIGQGFVECKKCKSRFLNFS